MNDSEPSRPATLPRPCILVVDDSAESLDILLLDQQHLNRLLMEFVDCLLRHAFRYKLKYCLRLLNRLNYLFRYG
jgi:hypothetical protein